MVLSWLGREAAEQGLGCAATVAATARVDLVAKARAVFNFHGEGGCGFLFFPVFLFIFSIFSAAFF
jgi:hypothetical protein